MTSFDKYLSSRRMFGMALNSIEVLSYQHQVLDTFRTLNTNQHIDPVSLKLMNNLGILDTQIASNSAVKAGIEQVIQNNSEALLRMVQNLVNGFDNLVEGFIQREKTLLKSTADSLDRYVHLLGDVHDTHANIVTKNVPTFHEFQTCLKYLYMYTKAVFSEKLQQQIGSDVAFGLKKDDPLTTRYSDVLPAEFTPEAQTKLGIFYKRTTEEEAENPENVTRLYFTPQMELPFAPQGEAKSLHSLGYADASEVKSRYDEFTKVVESLISELPELVTTCRASLSVAEQMLGGDDTVSADTEKKVLAFATVWGCTTESCMYAITCYTRAFQEILNTLSAAITERKE